MVSTRSDTAKARAKRWGLSVRHALYRKTGDWYHILEDFPGALLDADGFVVFESKESFQNCPSLRIRQHVNVPNGGIKRIPGYIWVKENAGVVPEATSFDKEKSREGARTELRLSRPERDFSLREDCLNHYGYSCLSCGFNFEEKYGAIGYGFIHVHHLKPLAEGERTVDPINDLVPLCPNCHSMAHRRTPPFTIGELREKLAKAPKKKRRL